MATTRRILVVEDHADTRETLLRLLSHEGWEVDGATGVLEAISKLDATPHCILMDWRFQDGHAEEVIDAALWHVPDVRIVVLSGWTDTAFGPSSGQGACPGVDMVLAKGCHHDMLLHACRYTTEAGVS